MKQEKSCGIIPYLLIDNEIHYLLVKQNNGFICFPKGHVEVNETEEGTALRECFEETGLKPSIVPGFRDSISYYMPDYDAVKEVVFFIGKLNDLNYKAQKSEITNIIIAPYKDAIKLLEYDNWQDLLVRANEFLKNKTYN